MRQSSFTAKELYGMAYLAKKQKMYGVPDAMGADRKAELQTVLDGLVSQGIADMDMDGKITLRADYFPTVSYYCDCEKCLTVNVRKEDSTEQSVIFWLHNDGGVMAEVMDDRYVFSAVDMDTVKAMVNGLLCTDSTKELTAPVVIPQLDIVKAKRACLRGNYAEAVRMMRQSGADSRISNAIVSGLQGHAYYLGLLYMDMQTGTCRKKDLSFLYSDGMILSLGQTVANLRTCATFTTITREDMHDTVRSFVNEFAQKGA